jgi:hypothetical protein
MFQQLSCSRETRVPLQKKVNSVDYTYLQLKSELAMQRQSARFQQVQPNSVNSTSGGSVWVGIPNPT